MTTKEAGTACGRTSDYVAQLARSGKVEGKKVGRTWLVKKESLDAFLGLRSETVSTTAVASASTDILDEKAAGRSQDIRDMQRCDRAVSITVESSEPSVPEISVPDTSNKVPFAIHAISFGTASAVVMIGFVMAGAPLFPHLANDIARTASEIQEGFSIALKPSITGIVTDARARNVMAYAAVTQSLQDAVDTMPALPLAQIDAPIIEKTLVRDYRAPRVLDIPSLGEGEDTFLAVRSSAAAAYSVVTNPHHMTAAALDAYSALGTGAYAGIMGALDLYYAGVTTSGVMALQAGVAIRDALIRAPSGFKAVASAAARGVVGLTRRAIAADVSFAYWVATTAPESARAVTAFALHTGDRLERGVALASHMTKGAYQDTLAASVFIAPALARMGAAAVAAGEASMSNVASIMVFEGI